MSSLSDIENIPDSYFKDVAPDLPVMISRYYYIQHLKDNNKLDSDLLQMVNQPDFYYYYINNMIESQPQFPNEIILQIALSSDNLDTIINMSLTNSYLNNKLKNKIYLNIIKNNVGVQRPVINWYDLIYENSKIHSTKYLVVDIDGKLLLENAIRDNNLELIEIYWEHFDIQMLLICNTPRTFKALIYEIQQLPKFGYTNYHTNIILSLPCILDNKFLPEYFKFIYNEIIPQWPQYFILDGVNIRLFINEAFNNAILLDYPIDQLFDHIDIINSCHSISVKSLYYYICNNIVGPNNIKYIDKSLIPLDNHNIDMVLELLESNIITDYSLDKAVTAGNYLHLIYYDMKLYDFDIDVVKYLVEVKGQVVTKEHINDAMRGCNYDIAVYLFNVYNKPFTLNKYLNHYVDLKCLQTIEYICPGKLKDIIFNISDYHYILGGDNDDISCIVYIYSMIGNYDFLTRRYIKTMISKDNIKCLAEFCRYGTISYFIDGTLLKITHMKVFKLTKYQTEKLKYYLN